jgi:hypothetical protein
MKIPKTTEELPYVKFEFDKKGNIHLSLTSSWWGGKRGGFISSDETEGNSCKPRYLKAYIKAFKDNKIKELKKQIDVLQKELDSLTQTP